MQKDQTELRAAFGRFMTGVTIVTARARGGAPVGFTANSFASVSLEPPMLMVCPGHHLTSFAEFECAEHFGVSVLAEGQEALANLFAAGKGDRFERSDWSEAANGIPLMDGRAAGFVCKAVNKVPAGDHLILIGEITEFDTVNAPGLGYGPNGYFTLGNERLAQASAAIKTRASVLLEDEMILYMTPEFDLPSVDVGRNQSPLAALQSGLTERGITADLSVVYAIYDEGSFGRRIVFRGQLKKPNDTLRKVDIRNLRDAPVQDTELAALLHRFENEHKTQSFGFYFGSDKQAELIPATKV